MALTDIDLGKIQKMINESVMQSFEQLFLPAFNSLDKRLDRVEDRLSNVEDQLSNVENRLSNVEGNVKGLKESQDEQFLALNERVDESIELIGYYFEKCATKDEHQALVGRVDVLELNAKT